MCFGGGNNAHHQEEEKRRQGGMEAARAHQAELDRRAQADRMRRMQEEADRVQQEMLNRIVSSSKQPYQVRTQADASTPLMRTRRKSDNQRRGVADLRIARTPGINTGGNSNSGINLG